MEMADSEETRVDEESPADEATVSDDPIQDELADLRAQLAALKAKSAVEVEEDEAEPIEAGEAGSPDWQDQVQEIMENLDKELKDTNPVTVLVVFALGVFMGRLLPR